MTHDKIPPQAIEIEESFLGSILLEGNKFEDIKTLIPKEAFYNSHHAVVFEAMHNIHTSNGKIDLLTVVEELKKAGHLENIGGASFVSNLSSRVSSASHLKYHSVIIYEKWVARELIKIGADLVDKSYEADNILDTLQNTRNAMDNRILHFLGIQSTGISIMEAAQGSIDDYYIREKNIQQGIMAGIPTTFKDLNKKTGGFQPEQLIVMAGRPGMGKTSLAISFMLTASKFKKKSAFFSLEMTSKRLMDKVICSLADVDHGAYKGGRLTDYDKKKAEECLAIIENMDVTFNDEMLVTIEQIHALCKVIKQKNGLDYVFIDYLQLMRTSDKTGNRENEISTMSRKAKMMAVDLQVPVLLLSQLNRSLENRSDKRPVLSDLRESGAIEQDADIVLFIYRHCMYNDSPKDEAELIIAKHREGELGKIAFTHNLPMTRFEDYEEEKPILDVDMDLFNESQNVPF